MLHLCVITKALKVEQNPLPGDDQGNKRTFLQGIAGAEPEKPNE